MGKITVVTGPMCSGKSLYLLMLLERECRRKASIVVAKPEADTREKGTIYSRFLEGHTIEGDILFTSAESLPDVFMDLSGTPKLLVIDEIQLLPDFKFLQRVVDIYSANGGTDMVLAGLDTDFRAVPFEITSYAMAIADEVVKLSAVCTCCGNDATRTQRLVNGEPAFFDDPLVVIDDGKGYGGVVVDYEPRCRHCHVVIKK